MPACKSILRKMISGKARTLEKSYLKAQFRRTVFEPTPAVGMIQIFAGIASLAAYTTTDPLAFRTLFAVGTVAGTLVPNFYRRPVLVLPIFWGVTFLAVNVTRITQLLMERKPVSFGAEEMYIYESTFYKYLTPNQFHKLMKISTTTTHPANTELKKEGVNALALSLIMSGSVTLNSVGTRVGVIDTTEGFKLTGIPRDATVPNTDTDNKMVSLLTASECTVLDIPHEELTGVLKKDVAMTSGLLRLFHERLLQKVLVRRRRRGRRRRRRGGWRGADNLCTVLSSVFSVQFGLPCT